MSVITVSRGSFSGGKMLAEALAEELGYRCISRESLIEKAAPRGVSQHELRKALEEPPSLLDRFKHKRYIYLAVIQATLAEEVRYGATVYHGHAGHLLLRGAAPVFRARVIAPMEMRIHMAERHLGLDRREVIAYIQKVDKERLKWARYLYGIDWADASLYDLVISLDRIDLDRACDLIARTVKGQKCFVFDSQCQAAMDNLARASRVKAHLALDPATSDLQFDVEADGGEVRIKGRVSDIHQVMEIERVARKVEGVTGVNLAKVITPVPD